METFLSFDERHGVILISFPATVTDDLLLSRFRDVKQWLNTNGPYSNITDFSGVTSFEVTAKGVGQLAASAPLVPDEYLRVVVAPQDNVFGMVRMFEMLGSTTRDRVHIVRTMAEAFSLTGIDVPEFRPVLNG